MSIAIREATRQEVDQLIPILLQAEESERALRWSLNNMADVVYRMDDDDALVGAATVAWREDVGEILELAIAPQRQHQGLGRRFIEWLAEEGRRRRKRALLVGTPNSSIGNIVFYQRCGLRMDHVRQDYFRYYQEPHFENGIQVRDMLVFRYDLQGDAPNQRRRRAT